jgi:hypothetical protein
MKIITAICLITLLPAYASLGQSPSAVPPRPTAQSQSSDFAASLRMQKQAESQQSTIAEFAQNAHNKNIDALVHSFSDGPLKATGETALRSYLTTEIVPFFSEFGKVDTYSHVNGASFEDGTVGVIHYLYVVTKSGQMKPFVIALRDESGKVMVMNVTVNQCVKGRHPVSKGRCDR